jgi:DNA polymerase-1
VPRYIFDCETNGFLDQLDRVHCLVLKDIDMGLRWSFAPTGCLGDNGGIEGGLAMLMDADLIIGHNIIGFDIPALQKVYPWFTVERSKVYDTMVAAKLYEGNVKEQDLHPRNKGKYPKQLFGQQSLEAWGYRLGDYKGDYKGPWDVWSQEMQTYCEQDVEVTFKLFMHLKRPFDGTSFTQVCWPIAERLEHDAQWLCSQIERNGIPFDVDGAAKLYGELVAQRERMSAELKTLFPPWTVFQGEVTSKANNRKTGHTIGAVYSKVLINEFNPQSRDHIANRLKAKYDWEPTEFTDGGKPQVDEQVLGALPYPEAKPLAELFLVEKRIGQIAEGKEAWLRVQQKGGWIHHRLNPNGAVTGRATHSKPNISQVPKVGSRWGAECRALFGLHDAPLSRWPGWQDGVLYGVDVAGLELRCLAHYMHRYDNGDYGRAVIEGKEENGTDVHSLNSRAIGLDPKGQYDINGKAQKGRNCAKTFIYAFLYGAGPEKIGKTIGKGLTAGKRTISEFLAKTPALKKLKDKVAEAADRGYLKALDGRHMHIRSKHAALNTLLQGSGALICKKWIVETDYICQDVYNLRHGWDGDYCFLIWAHDELQIACRTPEIAAHVDRAAKHAIKGVEAFFNIKVPLDVGGKVGKTWRDTH